MLYYVVRNMTNWFGANKKEMEKKRRTCATITESLKSTPKEDPGGGGASEGGRETSEESFRSEASEGERDIINAQATINNNKRWRNKRKSTTKARKADFSGGMKVQEHLHVLLDKNSALQRQRTPLENTFRENYSLKIGKRDHLKTENKGFRK